MGPSRPAFGLASCSTSSPSSRPFTRLLRPHPVAASPGGDEHYGTYTSGFTQDVNLIRSGGLGKNGDLTGATSRRLLAVRPAGIEPAACGLKDRCSLAPRREPLTTELRARAVDIHRLESEEPTFYAGPPSWRANAPRPRS